MQSTAANGWWNISLEAPWSDDLTAATTYDGATRYPVNGPSEPGLDVSGDGRGCNELAGTFTVVRLRVGPNNFIQDFYAEFTQHCEGEAPALHGEITLSNIQASCPTDNVQWDCK